MKPSLKREYPVNVYLPAPDACDLRRTIAKGAGIVGLPIDESVLIYYEGNLYGSINIVTYGDRCFHAADRMMWKGRGYPTIAQALVLPEQLLYIGTFDGRQVMLDPYHPTSARDSLMAWLEQPADLDLELRVSAH